MITKDPDFEQQIREWKVIFEKRLEWIDNQIKILDKQKGGKEKCLKEK